MNRLFKGPFNQCGIRLNGLKEVFKRSSCEVYSTALHFPSTYSIQCTVLFLTSCKTLLYSSKRGLLEKGVVHVVSLYSTL